MGIFVHVALHPDEFTDAGIAPHRVMVLCDKDLCVREHIERLLQVLGPQQRITHFGAADRQQVVHSPAQVLRTIEDLFIR